MPTAPTPLPSPPPLAPATRTLLEGVSTATLATQLFRRGYRTRFIRGAVPLHPELRLVGVARTLRCVPMREDLSVLESFRDPDMPQRRAVELTGPGEVLVIDARGELTAGTLGDILATRLQRRGAAGIVSDGPFRDVAGIRALGLPCYCAGSHAGTNLTVHWPVEVDAVIGCGGVLVEPGDVLVGDGDGVLVIPRVLAEEVARDAAEQERAEAWVLRQVQAGASILGLYPMDDATRAEYEAARARGEA